MIGRTAFGHDMLLLAGSLWLQFVGKTPLLASCRKVCPEVSHNRLRFHETGRFQNVWQQSHHHIRTHSVAKLMAELTRLDASLAGVIEVRW
eukprot:5011102-Amphidinium_carterae.1